MQTKFHVVGAVLVVGIGVVSQTSTQLQELDKNGKPVFPRPMPHVVYSPGDLAHNATVLPASAATPNTNVVRAGAATKLTLFVNCTQVVNVSVNVYTAADQSSSLPTWRLHGT